MLSPLLLIITFLYDSTALHTFWATLSTCLTQTQTFFATSFLLLLGFSLIFFFKWQRKATRESSGSGFILATKHGRNLITNAHVVADSTYVSVRKAKSATTYRARVAALSHESDLALLNVEEKTFWDGGVDEPPVTSLKLGLLPHLQDHVNVIGFDSYLSKNISPIQFNSRLPSSHNVMTNKSSQVDSPNFLVLTPHRFPTGGDGVSVTRGVVSRIEPIQYAHGSIHLLGVQIGPTSLSS